jgi:hypothetical protein
MNRWLHSVRALCTKRQMLLAVAIVLIVALAGMAPALGPYLGVAQSHKLPNHDSETDNEQLVTAPLSSTGSCGVERWSVKTGTDADSGLINLNSTTQTTISYLTSLPQPSTLPSNNRIQPTETTVYQLHDTLTVYKLETDSDYHLVLDDGSGHTMIVEIPDPACVGSTSPLLSRIQTARSEFDARYTPNGSFQTANVPVTVTGVGFFDFLHGQTGVAPNGIELHAVLDIQFGSGTPTPTPTPGGGGGSGITNGGFETGSFSGWTTSGAATSISTSSHSGSYAGQAGGTAATNGDSSIAQTFTAPSSGGSLSFWYKAVCPDTVTYDWATATLKDNTTGTTTTPLAKTCTNTGAWSQVSAGSLTAGHSYTLTLTSHDDNYSGDPTYTLYDDVAISTTTNDFSISANPSSLSLAQNTSGTSTISTTTTSGSAQAVNLSVSGVPSGASASLSPTSVTSGGSSTLTVNAGTAAAGAYTLTVTGTGTSATHSTTVSLTVTASGGNSAQLIQNGGFENGQTPWSESSSGGYQIVATSTPHTGSYSAYLCGYNNCTDQIWQTVTIPSTMTKATESFWLYLSTNESGSTCYDYFYARIRTSSGAVITTPLQQCNANAHGWTQYTFDVTSALSAYKGQQVQIYFTGTTDGTLTSSMYVDDVTFNVNY